MHNTLPENFNTSELFKKLRPIERSVLVSFCIPLFDELPIVVENAFKVLPEILGEFAPRASTRERLEYRFQILKDNGILIESDHPTLGRIFTVEPNMKAYIRTLIDKDPPLPIFREK